jgi:HPt (histidine-containing phosphotransfer) domain-containing protein
MSDQKLYSLSQLEDISSGDQAFVDKMVDMFIDMVPESTNMMVEALANEEYEELGKAAHKIKPSIDMMGILSLREKIRELERRGKLSEEVETIPTLLEDVVLTLNQVIEQLKTR